MKFNNAEEPTRMLILKELAKRDCQILWVSFDKSHLPPNLGEDKNLLYQRACEEVLREAIRLIPERDIHIIIDKRYSNRKDRELLEQHIMSVVTKNHTGNFVPRIRISQYDSFMSSELQVHDFIVGAIFQYLERNTDAYIGIIQSKIVFGKRR